LNKTEKTWIQWSTERQANTDRPKHNMILFVMVVTLEMVVRENRSN